MSVVVDASFDDLGDGAQATVAAAVATWQGVDTAHPPLVSVARGAADPIGYRKDGNNVSTIRYAKQGEPLAGHALGITIVTFDDAGQILDADIVINGGKSRPFALMGAPPSSLHTGEGEEEGSSAGVYDVQNVLTHELGHFFGLGETPDVPDATMFPTSARGETKKRDLADDDRAGLRSIYATAIAPPPAAQACSISEGHVPSPAPALALAAAGAAAWLLLRRRKAALATGVVFAALAASTLIGAPAARASVASLELRVVDVTSRWENGLIISHVELASDDRNGAQRASIEVFGGHEGGLTQIVGGDAAPEVGEVIPATSRAGRLVLRASLPPLRSVSAEVEQP